MTTEDPAQTDGLGDLIDPASVIHPPDGMAEIIDKTAEHVHRVGRNFESRLRERQESNRRFGFLDESNPFHRYYKWRLQIMSRREAADLAREYEEEMKVQEEKKAEERRKSDLVQAQRQVHVVELTLKQKIEQEIKLLRKPKEAFVRPHAIPRYENSKFIVPRPSMITPLELDVIKLTAQVTSVAGTSFANDLIAREERNPLFAFLQPTSEHWQYFQLLVDAYKYVWDNHVRGNFDDLARLSKDRVWDEAVGDAEWTSRENKKHDPEAEELERNANALIDWDDFVVLETIEIDPERDVLIPPGKTIKEINAILDVDRVDDEPIVALDNLEQEDMDIGSDSDDGSPPPIIEAQHQRKGPRKAPRPAPSGFVVAKEGENVPRIETAADELLRKKIEEMLKSQRQDATEYQKCPVCGDEIPTSHLADHIRIELLDPKWRDQKELLQQKMEDTSLAPNREIAANLSQFSKKHKEQFHFENQPPEKAKVAVQWDGHADTLAQNKAHAVVVDDIRRKEEEKERRRQKELEAQRMANAPTARGPQSVRPLLSYEQPHTDEDNRIPGSSGAGAPMPMRPRVPGGAPMGGMRPMPMGQPFQGNPFAMFPGRPPIPYGYPGMRPPPMYPPQMMVPGMMPPGMVPPHMAPGMPQPMPPHGVAPMGVRPGAPPQAQPRHPVAASAAVEQGRLDSGPQPKRQRLNDSAPTMDPEDAKPTQQPPGSIPEDEFLQSHQDQMRIRVVIPNDTEKHASFKGQTLTFSMQAKDTVELLKDRIQTVINFPENRQKLRIRETGAWIKNGTLAFYNIDGTSPLELQVKQRGGKK